MLEILQYIFSSFWIWLGTVILVATIGEALGSAVSVTVRRIRGD